ncbi:isomerase [Saccharomonospora xinjiangensis]|uniref:isomerase n=1 Tax=Saccharomonospora xinjiangensis TaxID=75294 RepID=UPI00106F84EF|nr:isomerase [Saccharomonospora xinjiangensis]QBQ61825.1 hypothetical protein EYD13_17405 [Saccharomonospora xinjiangensis]
MTTTSVDPARIITQYAAFWNAGTSEEQRRIADDVFIDEIEYRAVPGVWHGVNSMISFRDQFVDHVGAVTYRARTEPDHHHDRARLRWELVLADGTSFAEGTDILAFNADGRITSVTAFLDRAPAGGPADQHE